MLIKEALDLFYKSEYGKHMRISKYVEVSDGYILFPSEGLVPLYGSLYYIVKKDGEIQPVHPMLCRYNQDKVKMCG